MGLRSLLQGGEILLLRLDELSHGLDIRAHNLLELRFLHVCQLMVNFCIEVVQEPYHEISIKL